MTREGCTGSVGDALGRGVGRFVRSRLEMRVRRVTTRRGVKGTLVAGSLASRGGEG